MQLKRIKVGAVLFAIHWFAGMIHTSVIKITCTQCVINSARTVDTGRHMLSVQMSLSESTNTTTIDGVANSCPTVFISVNIQL